VRWTDFCASRPEAMVFHHPAWAGVLKDCYGYEPALLAQLDAGGRIVAGMPLMRIDSWLTGRRLVSLPFSDFCAPLAQDGAPMGDLFEGLRSWRRQNKAPEIQIRWPLPGGDGIYPTTTFARHVTPLDPEIERVFRSFAKTQVQQRIGQAERSGIRIELSAAWDGVRSYYKLHLETRRRLGAPVQPLRFFRLLWAGLISRDLGFVLLAYKDALPVAGAVFLHWNKTLTYKYGASNPSHWRLRPNNLLLWHAIRWGCEHGYSLLDWGRTDLANEGLRRFKRGWGSEEQILHYSVLADHSPKGSPAGKSLHFLSTLIRRSPAWVGRAMGELFYRHFG